MRQIFIDRGKSLPLSSRGRFSSEGSAFFVGETQKQIPRSARTCGAHKPGFTRNDNFGKLFDSLLRAALLLVRSFWRGLREWCGDAAYEGYLRSKGCHSDCCHTLSRAEFYVEQLDRRYSRPNRCC